MRIEPVFLFDLDGTLVDSVYQHVLAWKEALDAEGIELSVWRIHRKIGMSGGLFTNQLLRETGLEISADRVERLRQRHAAAYRRYADAIRPLPGARELLAWLTEARHPVGDRHQRAHGNRRRQPRRARRRSERTPGRDARSGQIRQARSGPVPGGRRPAGRSDRDRGGGRRQHLGHAGRQRAAARSASGCSRGGYGARRAAARPARSASTRTPPICCAISTRSAAGARAIRGKMGRSPGRGPDKSRARRWPNDKRRSRQSSAPCSRGVPP